MKLQIVLVLSILLMASALLMPALAAPPPISRPMELIQATIEGGSIPTVDPAASYDTASGELLFNTYETLLIFDGERMDQFLGQLATEWSIVQNFGNVSHNTDLEFYYTYYFKIRTGVQWQNPSYGTVTPEDVEYTFERGMVLECGDNPQWMLYEPLLNGATMTYINGTKLDPELNITDRMWIGWAIDEAVESNSTHVWFNLAFPGAYDQFLQILCQPWSSILCKNYVNSLGRASNWNGTWGDFHTLYYEYHFPEVPPLDDPEPAVMGTGPFILAHLDQTRHYWDADRFLNYWRGWGTGPAPNYGIGWPAYGSAKPAGYVDHIVVTWNYDWNARLTMFLNGEVDFVSVPRQYIGSILGQPNIRCTYPLRSLACEAFFFQMDINPTSPYGPIFDYGVIDETGIPRDFFGNATYGKYIRKAFAQVFDYHNYIQTVYLWEAMHPATALFPPVEYYNPGVNGYEFDMAAAIGNFSMWPELWSKGFTIHLLYNAGNVARKTACELMANGIKALNPKFRASAVGLEWAYYQAAMKEHQLPSFVGGWLADYPDPHNFVYPYYYTYGNYAYRARYSNATMDALIDEGIRTPDGPARAAIYSQIQQLAIDDCPNVPIANAVGRHFERTWVCGWYYNPVYGGSSVPGLGSTAPESTAQYFANLWKWYYTPHAQQDTIPANSTGNLLPYDVNYDGKTNMVDIGTTAASFATIYGPPMSSRWVYRCDFNNDRKIDMKDIGGVAQNFGKTSTAWTPTV